MSKLDPILEQLLGEVGQARKAGVFSTATSALPWQSPAPKQVIRFKTIRVAIPVAAAAAVAVLFVGPTLLKPKATNQVADSSSAARLSLQPTVAPQFDAFPSTARSGDCDYNGDGVIDGRDIQAFIDRLGTIAGNPRLEAEHLQRCLLGT
jgi:hypothetical protein